MGWAEIRSVWGRTADQAVVDEQERTSPTVCPVCHERLAEVDRGGAVERRCPYHAERPFVARA